MIHITRKKWLIVTLSVMILSIVFFSTYDYYIEKTAIDWEFILIRSIIAPLAITGFFWLWGDLKFEKKKKDEKTDHKN